MPATDAIVKETEDKMKKTLGVTQQEFSGLRTGRASTALVENLKVDYYGSPMQLKQIAAIGVADAKTLEIRPWDKNAIQPIEKAISSSELKLSPQRQGDVIRLVIPPLTEERRQELIKICRKLAEEGKVAVRNVRQESNGKLKSLKDVSEDEKRKLTARVQKLTDQYIAKIDEAVSQKTKEITTI